MIRKLLNEHKDNKKLYKIINELHPYDIAEELLLLEKEERERLYHILSNEKIAEIVSYLEPSDAILILEEIDLDKQSDILDEMPTDDAVDILKAYEDEEERDQLIETLEDVEEIKELILYEEDEAGAYMTNDFVLIHPDMDVKEATKSLIKQAPEAETINTLFVVDENNKFLGALPLKTLVKARSPKLVKEVMIKVPTVLDNSSIGEAIFDMKNYEFYELPVLDENSEMLGILTLDDILDAASEEAEEDYEKLAALPDTDKESGVIKTALHRLPWLIILVCLSLPIIFVTDAVSSSISHIAILVFFQPLMLDSPGNVATQTLAISLKTINNEGRMKFKDAMAEIGSGAMTGLILGTIAFLLSFAIMMIFPTEIVGASTKPYASVAAIISAVLALSLFIVVLLAPILAIAIPHLIKKIKLDPAVASGPFITTVIDVVGAAIYFGLATALLSSIGVIVWN